MSEGSTQRYTVWTADVRPAEREVSWTRLRNRVKSPRLNILSGGMDLPGCLSAGTVGSNNKEEIMDYTACMIVIEKMNKMFPDWFKLKSEWTWEQIEFLTGGNDG